MRIKEVIVVEGKNDTNVLQSYFDCTTIETHGTQIGEEAYQLIEEAKASCGVIIFTDPDYPGEYIRKSINQRIKGCKNAFIDKEKAMTTKKVGVEHASKEDLFYALSHLLTYEEDLEPSLSYDAYLTMGFSGHADSAEKRKWIANKLNLGKPNAKTLYKRLNMLRMKEDVLEAMLEEYDASRRSQK